MVGHLISTNTISKIRTQFLRGFKNGDFRKTTQFQDFSLYFFCKPNSFGFLKYKHLNKLIFSRKTIIEMTFS